MGNSEKVLNKLQKIYCPITADINKCEKQFSHLLGPPTKDTSITVHSPYIESGRAPNSSGSTPIQLTRSPFSSHQPTSTCLHNMDDNQVTINTLDETIPSCIELTPTAPKGTDTEVHSPIITVHSSPDIDDITTFPSQEGLLDPSPHLASSNTDWDIHQWEDMLYQAYSPSHPELGSSSPTHHDGDNIDADFKSKLLELFGPLSP